MEYLAQQDFAQHLECDNVLEDYSMQGFQQRRGISPTVSPRLAPPGYSCNWYLAQEEILHRSLFTGSARRAVAFGAKPVADHGRVLRGQGWELKASQGIHVNHGNSRQGWDAGAFLLETMTEESEWCGSPGFKYGNNASNGRCGSPF